jgi:serine phosphatase RsbU (regulator of sigma subunit)
MFEDLCRSDRFITIFCLSFEERSGERELACALERMLATTRPMVLRRGGGVDWLDDGGPMVGFMPGLAYADEELQFRAR